MPREQIPPKSTPPHSNGRKSVVSGLLTALLVLCGTAAAWFYGSYRRAMKRAHRAILDSQKRVLDAAQAEHDRTDAEISGLDGDALATAIDDAFPGSGTELSPDDANGDR